jgi:hypothetical protein
VAYFKIPSRNLAGETEEITKLLSVIMVGSTPLSRVTALLVRQLLQHVCKAGQSKLP